MADTIELLKEDVGDGLRDIQFREKAGRVSPMLLDQAVQAQLEGLGVEVYVLGVEAGLPGAINDFRVTWQPHAGGQPEHQWFDVNPPNGDWYVERWKLDGTVCATAWRCSLENAVDLARRAFRRGEVVRFIAPPGASQDQIENLTRLGTARRTEA